jgi:type IV pilus assembly protein PilO
MAISDNLKSLNNLPWYSQLGIFVLFGLSMVVGGWYFFVQGWNEQIVIKQKQLDSLKMEIQRGQAVEQKHQEFMSQNKQLLNKLATLKIILPEAKQTDQLLRQIQESALNSNLVIKKFAPLAVVQRDFFSEWPINLEVEGTYHSLGIFFDKLSKFPRIVNVSDVKIAEDSRKGDPRFTVLASCTATTFVFSEGKEPDQSKDAKGLKPPAKPKK